MSEEIFAIIGTPDADGPDFDPPRGDEPGKIIFEVIEGDSPRWRHDDSWNDFEIGEYYYEGGAFWINEGVGVDYFLQTEFFCPGVGIWAVEDITVRWHKDYYGEVDEDWEHSEIRPATEEEKGYLK